MNAVTDIEKMALAGAPASEVGALALVTMDPAKYVAEVYKPFRAKLAELVEASEAAKLSKPDLRTGAGMDVAIKHRAGFRDDIRIGAEKTRVERKAPLLAIGKLLDSDYKEVAAAALPHETYWDAEIKAEEGRKENERAAKIAAERARTEAIADRIAALREDETDAVRIDKTAEQTRATLEFSLARAVTPELFEERFDEAVAVHADVVASIRTILAQREADEAAAAEVEAARLAEIERIAAERAELAKLRAEADERERVAKAEAARVAAEQAAEAKRLAALAAEQAAELQKLRDAEIARANEAQAERDRFAAEAKRKMEIEVAEMLERRRALEEREAAAAKAEQDRIDAEALRQRVINDHAEALPMNAQFDVDREVQRVRLQALADEALAAGRERQKDEQVAGLPAGALSADAMADLSITDEPSDEEIITMVATAFDLSILDAVDRLSRIDFDAARTLAEAA